MTPISRFIALTTRDPLAPAQVRAWFRAVRATAPNGVPTTVPVIGEDGAPTPVPLVHRQAGDGHHYLVPLTRDLGEAEAEAVVRAFAARVPDLDFDVRATIPATAAPAATTPLPVDQERYLTLCAAFAKRQHARWLKERTDAGWRYGPSVSLRSKTHPLLRPWDELPDRFRTIDPALPQMLLDLLNEQGFAVITKDELDSLMALSRGAADA